MSSNKELVSKLRFTNSKEYSEGIIKTVAMEAT